MGKVGGNDGQNWDDLFEEFWRILQEFWLILQDFWLILENFWMILDDLWMIMWKWLEMMINQWWLCGTQSIIRWWMEGAVWSYWEFSQPHDSCFLKIINQMRISMGISTDIYIHIYIYIYKYVYIYIYINNQRIEKTPLETLNWNYGRNIIPPIIHHGSTRITCVIIAVFFSTWGVGLSSPWPKLGYKSSPWPKLGYKWGAVMVNV